MRGDTEAVVQILVERDHAQAVEERNEHEGHDELPDGKARDHLHVGKGIDGHRSGHRDEGHARNGGADHGEGGHVPRRAAVAGEESGIVGTAARNPGDGEKNGDIAQNGGEYGSRSHRESFCRFGLKNFKHTKV